MNVTLIHLTPIVVQPHTIGSESTLCDKVLTQNALRFPTPGAMGSMGVEEKNSSTPIDPIAPGGVGNLNAFCVKGLTQSVLSEPIVWGCTTIGVK